MGCIDDLLHPVHIGSKGRYNDAAVLVIGENTLQGLSDRLLGHGKAGSLRIGRIAQERQHSLLAQLAETLQINGITEYRCIVYLEVSGMDHSSDR